MKKTNNNIKCVIYARLSQEDGYDDRSISIDNQIDICKHYANNNGLIIKEILYDDGLTGTNFNRPGFQKLLDLISSKQINCILIKDLSRLGRNFLKVSYYVEEYFPKRNIRLISINDNYDSKNKQDEELTVAIRNFLNGYYAKEFIKKVRQSISNRSKKESLNYNGIYGYKYIKDKKTNERKLIVDEESANVVKRIFDLFLKGVKASEIAKILTNEKVLSPLYYRQKLYNIKNLGYHKEDNMYKWNKGAIYRILKNYEYLGKLANYKRDSEKTIIHENTHEAIITEEVYNKVQTLFKKTSLPRDLTKERLYKILYTKAGKCLTYSTITKEPKYYYKDDKGSYIINAKDVHELLYNESILYLKKYKENNEEFINRYLNKIESKNIEDDYNKFSLDKKKYEKRIQIYFEKFVEGEVSKINYEFEINLCNTEIKRLNERINELAYKKVEIQKQNEAFYKYLNSLENLSYDCGKFNLIYLLIKKVTIEKKDKKEYKFNIAFKYDL